LQQDAEQWRIGEDVANAVDKVALRRGELKAGR
jgi:hypothetical protein